MPKRSLTFCAALATTLSFPAAALAAKGVVLSVDRSHHVVQIIDAKYAVHAYHYRRLPGVHAGTKLTYTVTGKTLRSAKANGVSRKFSFLAHVIHSGNQGLALKLGDGNKLTFSPKQLQHASAHAHTGKKQAEVAATSGNVTINIEGLQPGETVLITESTDANGNLTITITLTGSSAGGGVVELQDTGVVSAINDDTFDVTTGDGSTLHLHMAADALSNLNMSECDNVSVTYHKDASMLIADNVVDQGPNDSCNGGGGAGGGDITGTITAVSNDSITINADDGSGLQTFSVQSPDDVAGFQVGDDVDVTYETADDGSLIEDAVEYNDQTIEGQVTAVTQSSITVTDDWSGDSVTLVASDPSELDGVAVGDDVSASYYQSAAGLSIDSLEYGN